ncbi:hypothetical protein [Streptomyces sp. CAI-85]|uniref:hypothetical protein n=1 Tax=Streptomyces sp. CAI-85 TaxID=1472662 RepID=UPI00158722C7|nr:hypothetical protein [Streptomyces sp. CAI-85]NUV64832.1 hypothetical protein [Streptomyces sp. CAI-85]
MLCLTPGETSTPHGRPGETSTPHGRSGDPHAPRADEHACAAQEPGVERVEPAGRPAGGLDGMPAHRLAGEVAG